MNEVTKLSPQEKAAVVTKTSKNTKSSFLTKLLLTVRVLFAIFIIDLWFFSPLREWLKHVGYAVKKKSKPPVFLNIHYYGKRRPKTKRGRKMADEKITGKILGFSLFGVAIVGIIAVLAVNFWAFLKTKFQSAGAPSGPSTGGPT